MSMTVEEKKPSHTRCRKVRCPKCGAEIDRLRVVSKEAGELRVEDGKPASPLEAWGPDKT